MILNGQRYGRLLVIDKYFKEMKNGSKQAYWHCKCDCGQEVVVNQGNLRSGKTRSCGCLRVDKVNDMLARRRGETETPEAERLYLDRLREKFGHDNVKVSEWDPGYWINVSDRLPCHGQRVVFMSEARPFWKIHWGVFLLYPDGSYEFTEGYLETVHDVTCWIPEPKHLEDE